MDINECLIKERDIQKRFKESVLKDYFKIRFNERWKTASSYAEFDIILLKNDIPYSIVEIKMSLNAALSNAKHQISKALQLTNCRFGIITDNSRFLIIDTKISYEQYEELDFDQIVQRLIRPDAIPQTGEEEENIKKSLEIYFQKTDQVLSICNDIKYDESQGVYTFETINKEKEFFQRIIGLPKGNVKVYRYTSLDALFVMLNKGTYRMNGIVGMNDKSEINYFDKKCPIDKSGSSVRKLNETFLSSCSCLKDDLTMWRLYGDDAKGVCLEFDLNPLENSSFVLASVNYASTKREHKALKMLKGLSDANVRFAELNKWKHFFKSYDYSVEKEIRLMFLDNGKKEDGISRDWVKTWSHSIINPVVDFDLRVSAFPLQLKRIILGRKMPECKTNKSQLEDLISYKGYSIEVVYSSKMNYR